MDIKDYLAHYVEGYLLTDLENLEELRPKPGKNTGAASYPMLLTILAGMEMLGIILYPDTLSFEHDDKCNPVQNHFGHYWGAVLSELNPEYKPFQGVMRVLVRNPLAHAFQTTLSVVAYKADPDPEPFPIRLAEAGRGVVIECRGLYRDFRESYRRLIRPIIDEDASISTKKGTITSATMQARLDELLAAYQTQEEKMIRELLKAKPVKKLLVESPQPPLSDIVMSIGAAASWNPLAYNATFTTVSLTSGEKGANATLLNSDPASG